MYLIHKYAKYKYTYMRSQRDMHTPWLYTTTMQTMSYDMDANVSTANSKPHTPVCSGEQTQQAVKLLSVH